MTLNDIIVHLLDGCIIRPRFSLNRKYSHALYTKDIKLISLITYSQMYQLAKEHQILKGNKVMTIDLRMVRKKHGNSTIKKLYKKAKSKNHANREVNQGIPVQEKGNDSNAN